MDDLLHQFFEAAKTLKLSDGEKRSAQSKIQSHVLSSSLSKEERDEVLENIVAHMRANPIASSERVSVFAKLGQYAAFHPSTLLSVNRFAAAAMCAVLLLGMGGSVTYAAEDALPDELLYNVKMHVNEPVLGAYHRVRRRELDWEERRMQRRMREAEMLSENGRLSTKLRARLEQRLEERSTHIERHLEGIASEEERTAVRDRIDQQFQRHVDFLDRLEEGDVTPQEVHRFHSRMREMHKRFRSQQLPPAVRQQIRHQLQSLPEKQIRNGVQDRTSQQNGQRDIRQRRRDAELPHHWLRPPRDRTQSQQERLARPQKPATIRR